MPHQAISSTFQLGRGHALQARGQWFEPTCAHRFMQVSGLFGYSEAY